MSLRFFIKICGVLILSAIQPVSGSAAEANDELHFGSVAMDVPTVMHRRLTPLTQYLSKELGKPVRLKLAKNMPGAIDDVSTGVVELAYLTPVAYIKSHKKATHVLLPRQSRKGGVRSSL